MDGTARRTLNIFPDELKQKTEKRLLEWEKRDFFGRLCRRDPLLWNQDGDQEIINRLGWLELPETSIEKCAAFEDFSRKIRAGDYQHIVLLGMGGSSLAPEVFQNILGSTSGHPQIVVCDTTHPAGILAVEENIDLERALFLVSSKSGTTLETLSLFRYFWERISSFRSDPGRQFVAITDPHTPLDSLARERGFRQVFLAPPDVGGRFSALSDFGLVPAALIGVNVRALLDSVKGNSGGAEDFAAGLRLGASLGELAKNRNKLTIFTHPSAESFPDWLEQLIAESLGKEGQGLIPITGEPIRSVEQYGDDRSFVFILFPGNENSEILRFQERLIKEGYPVISLDIKDRIEIGKEMFKWETAIAAAASILGIHPFDQPDVQLTKKLTQDAMDGGQKARGSNRSSEWDLGGQEKDALIRFVEQGEEGDYIALQAFLPPQKRIKNVLQEIRIRLAARTGMATTLGFGPRYLHSTGQLHKGGPDNGLFVQLVDSPQKDLPVPESGFSFGQLIMAQAEGDYNALKKKGRRIIRIHLGQDTVEGLETLLEQL